MKCLRSSESITAYLRLMSIIFMISLTLSCSKSVGIDKKEAKEFFSQLDERNHWGRSKSLLIDSVVYDKKLFNKIISDEKSLSLEDRNFLQVQLADENYKIWKKDIFPAFKIVNRRYIDSVAKPDPFIKTPAHLRISKPYFTPDKKHCFIFFSFYCGNLCAETTFQLFEKIDRKWTYVKSYFSVVS